MLHSPSSALSINDTSIFKKQHSFKDRAAESLRILTKHPDRIPIICEKSKSNSYDLPNITKNKYLVPKDLTVCQFNQFIRTRLNLASDESLFLFINKKVISSTSIFGEIYEFEKDKDGFMYIEYAKEQTFG
jgi:GABA(A) receptor-associated protein